MSAPPDTSLMLRCPTCGYNLTGLPENRCPECGERFDPVLLRQSLHQLRPMPIKVAAAYCLLGSVIVILMTIATILTATAESGLLLLTFVAWYPGTLALSVFLAVRVAWDHLSFSQGLRNRWSRWWMSGLAFLGFLAAQHLVISVARWFILSIFYAHGGHLPFDH